MAELTPVLSAQANNTLNQNPCQIAGALEAACQGFGTFEKLSISVRIVHELRSCIRIGSHRPGNKLCHTSEKQ